MEGRESGKVDGKVMDREREDGIIRHTRPVVTRTAREARKAKDDSEPRPMPWRPQDMLASGPRLVGRGGVSCPSVLLMRSASVGDYGCGDDVCGDVDVLAVHMRRGMTLIAFVSDTRHLLMGYCVRPKLRSLCPGGLWESSRLVWVRILARRRCRAGTLRQCGGAGISAGEWWNLDGGNERGSAYRGSRAL